MEFTNLGVEIGHEEKPALVPNLVTSGEGFNLFKRKEDSVEGVMGVRRKHMQRHFDDLTSCYFSNRVQKG